MTVTLWINTFFTQAFDILIRFEDREAAVDFTRMLFDKYAQNIKTADADLKEKGHFTKLRKLVYSVWNPTSVLFPGLGTDCTLREMGSGDYTYKFPYAVMNNGFFKLAWIRGDEFNADIYLGDENVEPVQKYLLDMEMVEIKNYTRIAYVSEFDACKMLLGGETVYCEETDWDLYECPERGPGENNVVSYFNIGDSTEYKGRAAPYDFTKT
jgi:hypothetical protein